MSSSSTTIRLRQSATMVMPVHGRAASEPNEPQRQVLTEYDVLLCPCTCGSARAADPIEVVVDVSQPDGHRVMEVTTQRLSLPSNKIWRSSSVV